MTATPLTARLPRIGAARSARARAGAWVWLASVTLLTLLLVEIPSALAARQAAQGLIFSEMFLWPHDYAQYAAAMREGGSSGSWLVHNHLTGEPHEPAFIYPFYVALGKLAAALGWEVEAVYHAAGTISRVALLAAIFSLAKAVLPTPGLVRAALLLTVYASGASLLVALPRRLLPGQQPPLFGGAEFRWPEFNTFLALFGAPHLILGLALLLLFARCYLVAWSSPRLLHSCLAGAATLGLVLVNPYSLVTVCGVVGAHLLIQRLARRPVPPGAVVAAGLTGAVAAPYFVYALLIFDRDPFWGVVYGTQNQTFSPTPSALLLGLGPVLALALLGLRPFLQRGAPGTGLILAWVAVSLVLMYLPLGIQRRFAYGLGPMLCLVAAFGLERVGRSLRSAGSPVRLAGLTALLVVLGASTAAVYAVTPVAGSLANPTSRPDLFQPAELRQAADWLASNMLPDDVVLSEVHTGNFIAARIPGRVYVGHWSATLQYVEKHRLMQQFYRGEGDLEARLEFLTRNRIRYVLFSPRERLLGGPGPVVDPCLAPVFSAADIHIFSVQPGNAGLPDCSER